MRRPSRYRMSTVSTGCPSAVWKRALTVPSRDSRSVRSSSVENGTVSASVARSGFGSVVITS